MLRGTTLLDGFRRPLSALYRERPAEFRFASAFFRVLRSPGACPPVNARLPAVCALSGNFLRKPSPSSYGNHYTDDPSVSQAGFQPDTLNDNLLLRIIQSGTYSLSLTQTICGTGVLCFAVATSGPTAWTG